MNDLALIAVSQKSPRKIRFMPREAYFTKVGSDRVSPLMFLDHDCSAKLPGDDDDYYLAFCFHRCPAVAANKLLHAHRGLKFPSGAEQLASVWLTLGLASVVMAARSLPDLEHLLATLKASEGFTGVELWTVRGGTKSERKIEGISAVTARELNVPTLEEVPADLRDVLVEAGLAAATIISHAQIYAPEHLHIFVSAWDDFRELVEESLVIEKLTDPQEHDKTYLNLFASGIELATALAYADSQWFSGSAPILVHPSQIRPHSLLGIGTPSRSLANLVCHLTQNFDESRLELTFREGFLPSKAFDICRGQVEDRLERWKAVSIEDTPAVDTDDEPSSPLLTYYSSRRGFRESRYSVTAPTNTLRRCLCPRWSIRNITHEILHVHVKKLLADVQGHSEDWLAGYLAKNPEFGAKHPGFDEFDLADLLFAKPNALQEVTAGVSLWVSIYTALRKIEMVSQSFMRSRTEKEKRDRLRFKRIIEKHFSELNEIIVHILDFRYFFNKNSDEYVTSLWESWSLVAVVRPEIDFYVRRTVLALTTNYESKSPADRVDLAADALLNILVKQPVLKNLPLAITAADYLKSAAWRGEGKVQATQRMYTVDLVQTLLCSDGLASRFFADENVSLDGKYDIKPYDFPSKRVASPVAFAACIEAQYAIPGNDEELLSFWALLHLASAAINSEVVDSNVL